MQRWEEWEDLEDKLDEYGLERQELRKAFDAKVAMIEDCRNSWPAFATYDEDIELSDDELIRKYLGIRPNMWDMSDVKMPKASDARIQRATWSSYYSANCLKGGIGLQTCGWIRTHDLWTGCVSDTAYQATSGIFDIQKEFGEKDLVGDENEYIPFTSIFDKGYRNRLAAWKAGQQLTLQPTFAKSDRRFRRQETLSSAIVASDRSGNERAVRLCKMSGYISRGLDNNQSFERMHKVWLCWGFQVNFMFSTVL